MKLALGTAQIGLNYGIANNNGQLRREETAQLLKIARENGIDTLDTAVAYGVSESVLGEIGVSGWRVITKLPALPDDCNSVESWIFRQVESSLARLGVDHLYGLLLHNPLQLLHSNGKALYSALQKIKSSGYAKKVGISLYFDESAKRILDRYSFDLIQIPFNIFDQRFFSSGKAEQVRRQGGEIHIRSMFLQGLLLMSASDRPSKFNKWSGHWQEWDRWLSLHGLSPLEACMRFVHSFEWIDRVVVGVDSSDHLLEILRTKTEPLTDFPIFSSLQDDRLLNPASWSQL